MFAETRLRRGVYGQRYDNGQRHDGVASQRLEFPSGELTKGPETLWDAPGHASASRSLRRHHARAARRASRSWRRSTRTGSCTSPRARTSSSTTSTSTTRRPHAPAGRGRTSPRARPAATACATSRPARSPGVCHTEAFDVTPYADGALPLPARPPRLPGLRPQVQAGLLGLRRRGLRAGDDARLRRRSRAARSWTASSGARSTSTSAAASARRPTRPSCSTRTTRSRSCCRTTQAIARVFAPPRREAEPQPRAHQVPGRQARHRRVPPPGRRGARDAAPRRRAGPRTCRTCDDFAESPVREAVPVSSNGARPPAGYAEWARTNVYRQRQPGYAVATIALPLGDISSEQTRALADVARRYVGDTVRTTVEQNIVLRWVAEGDLPALYAELAAIDLAAPGRRDDRRRHRLPRHRHLQARHRRRRAGSPASCAPASARASSSSTRPCAACASRSAAASTPAASTTSPTSASSATAARSTACTVPHFQVVLGGRWRENAGSYGLAIGAVPLEAHPRGRRRHHDPLRGRARRRARPSRTTSPASARRSWAR